MSPRLWTLVTLCLLASGAPFAQSVGGLPAVDWFARDRSERTFAAAGLAPAEQQQIRRQVAATSFDVPDSWAGELRVQRIALGQTAGLIVRGTRLLCGGTGNCQTWIFRRENRAWRSVIAGDAPIVSGLGLIQQNTAARDLVTTSNLSADEERWTRYRFDGKVLSLIHI